MEPSNRRSLSRRGFTLAEVVVALAIMSILLVGAGAAVSMTVSAADTNNDPNTRFTETADVMDRLLADVQSATAVTERLPGAITVVVPDRTGDGLSEQIRYAWTGTSGGVLTRAVNAGPASTVLRYVNDLKITPMLRSGAATTESAEQRLIGCDDWLGGSLSSKAVDASHPAAQYIKPPFDSTVTAWRVTRVRIYLSASGTADGTARISLVLAQNWTPTGATLTSVDIAEASLSATASAVDLTLPSGSLSPSQGVFLKVESVGNSAACNVQLCKGAVAQPYNTFFTSSLNGGTTYSAPQDAIDACFVAWGMVTTGN